MWGVSCRWSVRGIAKTVATRTVTFTETNTVHVDYTYAASFRIPGVKGQEWKHTIADNRLELSPEGEGFKILSGM